MNRTIGHVAELAREKGLSVTSAPADGEGTFHYSHSATEFGRTLIVSDSTGSASDPEWMQRIAESVARQQQLLHYHHRIVLTAMNPYVNRPPRWARLVGKAITVWLLLRMLSKR